MQYDENTHAAEVGVGVVLPGHGRAEWWDPKHRCESSYQQEEGEQKPNPFVHNSSDPWAHLSSLTLTWLSELKCVLQVKHTLLHCPKKDVVPHQRCLRGGTEQGKYNNVWVVQLLRSKWKLSNKTFLSVSPMLSGRRWDGAFQAGCAECQANAGPIEGGFSALLSPSQLFQ